ncbi:MAG: ABC transporter ATP-binding protein [Acidimicrobiia bacterium]
MSLAVEAGTTTFLVGGNGSGKSTLLRVLAGLAAPQQGTVRVHGRDIASCSRRALARRLAHLPQAPLVPDGVTVEELVVLGRHPHRPLLGGPDGADREAVRWAMGATGVAGFAGRMVSELSGGERQRAWVALALAQQAPVVLLDEPTTFLDIRHQLEVLELLRGLARRQGLAVLAVLHDLNQAAAFADRLVVLGSGRVLAQGRPAEVLTAGLVRRAFGVDADVERRGGTVTCHFRPLTTDAPPASPPQGEPPDAQAAPAPPGRRRRPGGRLRRGLGPYGRRRRTGRVDR